MWRRGKNGVSNRKTRLRLQETLETRQLLAGDLIAHWNATSIATDETGAITGWTDSVGNIEAEPKGAPVLLADGINGRPGVQFNATDGDDLFRVRAADSPLARATDFSAVVVFETDSQSLVGGNGNWFQNSGLVDSNSNGLSTDWGLTMNASGQVAAGMGDGFGNPSKTVYSTETGLNNGEHHVAVISRSGANLSVSVDGQPFTSVNDASSQERARLDLTIGALATGNNGFTGVISEVRLYNGALSQAEVNTLYSQLDSVYNNGAPIAVDDAYELTEDPGFFFIAPGQGVLANDSDPDGDALTAVVVDTVKHGTLALVANGSFSYAPERNFFGTDSFTYTANDFRASEPATVTFTVTPTYDAPAAVADSYLARPATVLRIPSLVGVTTNDSNPDGASLETMLVQDVANGTLTFGTDGSFTYDPGAFTGTATFSYRVTDGTTPSAPATVSIRVNSAPIASDDNYTTPEDSALSVNAATGVLANDVDNEGDALTITLLDTVTNGELSFSEEDGSFDYTPNANFSGVDSFTYKINDGLVDANATVTIQVEAVNDSPIGSRDSFILEQGTTIVVPAASGVLANDIDIDNDVLTASLVTQAVRGTVTLNANGSFEYNTAEEFVGIDSFSYTVSDGVVTSTPIQVDLIFEAPRGNTNPTGDSIVTFNELMYNPPAEDDSTLEWVELHNQQAIDMDISGWSLDGGFSFDFAEGTVIPGGGYLVIASNPEELAKAGYEGALGPFVGRLSNGGETIELRNNSNRIMDIMNYSDRGDWPVEADGTGATLAKVRPHTASIQSRNWSFSDNVGGTPGAENFASQSKTDTLMFTEIAAVTSDNFQIEIGNYGDTAVNLQGMQIASTNPEHAAYTFGAQTINPGGYVAVNAATLGFTAVSGDVLSIVSADGSSVKDARIATSRLRGMYDGEWIFPASETFGAANHFEFNDAIVINEIMYHAPGLYIDSAERYFESNEQWLELYNRSDAEVDMTGWSFSDGLNFDFPEGTKLGAGQYLVVSNDPQGLAAKYGLDASKILGPFNSNLANGGELLRLVDTNNNPVDAVEYYDNGRWAQYADGRGSSLELLDPNSDNNVAESWAASDESTKSPWVTINYKGLGTNVLNGPTTYNELLLGMLDRGEVLLDDISVIENPGTPDAVEVIQNGTFEGDAIGGEADKWRIIGTQHGTVIEDPTDPNNKVLHLLATGPTEHMHNNAGTTFKVGDDYIRIDRSAEYEITFRAKWVGGSNQLHSRIYFNRLARQTRLPMSDKPGTPGERNSVAVDNAGPTYEGLMHSPVVPNPNEPVTVSVRAADPNGVSTMKLYYSVAGGPMNSVNMTDTGDGLYEGTIPGQAAELAVQFYVEGTDGNGATSMFPADGPASRALYRVQDGEATDTPLHNFRIVMTPDDTSFLHLTTNVMSNNRIGATVIYNESEVFYNVGVRLKGSQRGRDKVVRAGFNLRFDPMQPFRGVHEIVGIDRSGSGDEYSQEEIIVRQILNHAGDLPQIYDDLVYVIAPQDRHTGTAMLTMARYNDVFLDSMYENGSQGTAFEYELVYYPTSTVGGVEGLKRPNPDSVTGQSLRDLGDDKEFYRWYFLIKNNRARDDYSTLLDALKLIGRRSSEEGYQEDAARVLDVDEWLRALAVQNLAGIGDNYSSGAQHNGQFYVHPNGKLLHLPWDMDFSFTAGTSVNLIGNTELRKLLDDPGNEHNYYGHVWDILQTTFNAEYMDPWVDHFDELVPRQRYAGFKTTIDRRHDSAITRVTRAIEEVPFEIGTAGPLNVGNALTATLTGSGWVDVRTIQLQGSDVPLDITWTDPSTWRINVPVSPGTNDVVLEAYDFQGQLAHTATISVTSTAVTPVRDFLRVSEIHYNPAGPTDGEPNLDNNEFEFVELINIGSTDLQLDGARLAQVEVDGSTEGIEFTFATQTLGAGERIVVAKNIEAFRARYGDSARLALGSGGDSDGVYSGRLANGGETITLLDSSGAVVQQFAYDDSWHPSTDGDGPSLERTNPADADLNLWNQAASWIASGQLGGTPGRGGAPIGDSNYDGVFDSGDLVLVMQAGEYEDGIPNNSTWEEGDWNGDGDF
ncbi:MAG: tandem-95 repeat protein, partial [Planctomycetales bacterium]|nr:tandem-95 repeat protein [Planctomycetales bacterium]